ncbi:MAG: hypothetical protein NTY69_08225 [Methylococcales bacterium]|nr:hypothetical protein [Methylococcales bacterium]
MNKRLSGILVATLCLVSQVGFAKQITLPIDLDYNFIKKEVVNELYKGEGHTAEVWNDKKGCSYLKLSDLQVSGQQQQIKLQNHVQARIGATLGGKCLKLIEWQGNLETLQQPTLNKEKTVLSLPVTQVAVSDLQGRQLNDPKIQDLITQFVAPKLSGLKLDLNASRADIEKTVQEYVPKEDVAEVLSLLNSLRITDVVAKEKSVGLKFAFNSPSSKARAKKSAAPLTEAEQKKWQVQWDEWNTFLTKSIEQAVDDAKSPELRDALTETLVEARVAFQTALTTNNLDDDPVRVFFTDTWERLAPQLKELSHELPEVKALQYVTFIAATDVMYELEKIGAPFGLEISSEGLRNLARIIIAKQQS